MQAFSAKYPNTRIELEEYVLNGGIDMFKTGEIDLLISARIPQALLDNICTAHALCPFAPLITHCYNSSAPLTYEDLAQHRQVVLRDSVASSALMQAGLEPTNAGQ